MTDLARWHAAFRSLRWVERRCGLSQRFGRRRYLVDGGYAKRADLSVDDLSRPARSVARQVGSTATALTYRSTASVLSLGQFDVGAKVRFHAFHDADGRPATSLGVQGSSGDEGPGLARAAAARRQVATHVPDLAPELLCFGSDARRGIDYLHEMVVDGRHPRNPSEVLALLPPLADGLARLHAGVGVSRIPAHDAMGARFAERWRDVVEHGPVPAALGTAVDRLVDRDALVEVSLGHGDLVRTNLLRVPDGVVLLDWEYARSMPIAFDLAKPVFLSADREAAVDELRSRLASVVATSTDSYSLEEQLSLGIALLLSWSDNRRRRAVAAGRLEFFERDTDDRVSLLARLLG